METTELDKKLRKEGYTPIGLFSNSYLKDNLEKLLNKILEGPRRENQFRIIPAYLIIENEYRNCHVIYSKVEGGFKEVLSILSSVHECQYPFK